MKRTKLLALTLAVVIMMMGAGYAIWSDQVFLTSTVRTGNFDMEMVGASIRTGDNQTQNEAHDWHQFDWTHSGTVSKTADSATVEFLDMYPGGVVQVDLKVENKGTIPAKLKSINVEFVEGNYNLFSALKAQSSWKADITGDKVQDDWGHVYGWEDIQTAMNSLVEDTKDIVIEPKGWMSFGEVDGDENGCIQFKLDSNAGNEYQDQACKFKVTFNWEQWASDPSANPYNAGTLPGYGGDGDLQ